MSQFHPDAEKRDRSGKRIQGQIAAVRKQSVTQSRWHQPCRDTVKSAISTSRTKNGNHIDAATLTLWLADIVFLLLAALTGYLADVYFFTDFTFNNRAAGGSLAPGILRGDIRAVPETD